jgi:hypothetical protein
LKRFQNGLSQGFSKALNENWKENWCAQKQARVAKEDLASLP